MGFLKRLLSAIVLIPVVIYILHMGGLPFQIFLIVLSLIALYEFWFISGHEVKRRWQWSVFIFGCIYTVLAAYSIYEIRIGYGFVFTGLILIGIWASDIGGYIFGKLIGGRKLCPSISPNKTWAGLIGACLFPFFILDGYLAFFATELSAKETFAWSLGASLIIGLMGQFGDLLVSKLKRRVGLKDTGRLIPGHGGILDRIDALMLVMIVIWLMTSLKVIIWDTNLLAF
jgi:phosphatidate cytidylyltransferase